MVHSDTMNEDTAKITIYYFTYLFIPPIIIIMTT